jgi:hypothetical protein
MATFKSEEQLQEEANAAKKQLLRDKVETKKQRDAIKWQIQVLSGAYEKRKRVRSLHRHHHHSCCLYYLSFVIILYCNSHIIGNA